MTYQIGTGTRTHTLKVRLYSNSKQQGVIADVILPYGVASLDFITRQIREFTGTDWAAVGLL
jgi:hypothetical protein